jgi:hypothetical protein
MCCLHGCNYPVDHIAAGLVPLCRREDRPASSLRQAAAAARPGPSACLEGANRGPGCFIGCAIERGWSFVGHLLKLRQLDLVST